MSLRDVAKRWLRMCGDALTVSARDRLFDLDREVAAVRHELQNAKFAETEAALLQASIHIVENLHALAGRTAIEIDASLPSAEAALFAFLYSQVPSRVAVEIGGTMADDLLAAGFEVRSYAPAPVAEAAVAMPANGRGARFIDPWSDLPERPGILCLGGDPAQSLRETGDRSACVIASALTPAFAALVSDMRAREYHWHLAIYRSPAHPGVRFHANHTAAIPDSSGTAFFFRDFRAFAEAHAWCAAALTRTYFKPPPA